MCCRRQGRRGPGRRWCARSVISSRPCRRCRDTRWAEALERACDRVLEHGINLDPPTTATRRGRWPVGVGRSDSPRTSPASRSSTEEEHDRGVGDRRPARPTRHRRRRWTASGWMCAKPSAAGRSPATTGWWWSSARPVRARRRCSPRRRRPPHPRPHSVRRGADGEGGPCPANVRHGCAATPSPSSCTSGTAPTGHHDPTTSSPPARPSIVDEAGMIGTPACTP